MTVASKFKHNLNIWQCPDWLTSVPMLTLPIPFSYVVYGPLANGGTSLLFEPTTTYPDPGRYWSTVAAHQLTHFYGAPTAIRLLIR